MDRVWSDQVRKYENKKYEISFVVVTYNPNLEKLMDTLKSIIVQKEIDFEIVISDDGSANNCFPEIKSFFQNIGFVDYQLIENSENQGTVKNILMGIMRAGGKYVKTISPGDKLCHDLVIRRWVDFLKQKNAKWSFSKAYYYQKKDNEISLICEQARPNDLLPYLKHDDEKCRWNYVVFNDVAVGAVMLSERNLQLEYLKKIVNKVVYAEDHIWRMMMFDGYVGCYYPENTIFYEYGTGISTVNENKWRERLDKDWHSADEIMINSEYPLDNFQKKMIAAKQKKSFFSKIFVKGKVRNWYLWHFRARKTETIIH